MCKWSSWALKNQCVPSIFISTFRNLSKIKHEESHTATSLLQFRTPTRIQPPQRTWFHQVSTLLTNNTPDPSHCEINVHLQGPRFCCLNHCTSCLLQNQGLTSKCNCSWWTCSFWLQLQGNNYLTNINISIGFFKVTYLAVNLAILRHFYLFMSLGRLRLQVQHNLLTSTRLKHRWTVGGDGGCRVGEVRAGTTSPMPDHKGFKLQELVRL